MNSFSTHMLLACFKGVRCRVATKTRSLIINDFVYCLIFFLSVRRMEFSRRIFVDSSWKSEFDFARVVLINRIKLFSGRLICWKRNKIYDWVMVGEGSWGRQPLICLIITNKGDSRRPNLIGVTRLALFIKPYKTLFLRRLCKNAIKKD